MRIEHIAMWVDDLEKMKDFYVKYFSGKSNEKYYNPEHEFGSYFLEFGSGARLEIMKMERIRKSEKQEKHGFIHMAFSTGSKEEVDRLTKILENDGYTLADRARTTGDGYYESVVLDPEGNRVEITI